MKSYLEFLSNDIRNFENVLLDEKMELIKVGPIKVKILESRHYLENEFPKSPGIRGEGCQGFVNC